MSRRRADKLDSHSRQACRANGRRRVEIELDEADCYALDVLAAHYVISRSRVVVKLLRFWQAGPPANPFGAQRCPDCGELDTHAATCPHDDRDPEIPSPEFEASLPDP